MTIVNGYATQAEAIRYIGINSAGASVDDLDYLDTVITGVSRDIDNYCHRTFFGRGTSGSPYTRLLTSSDDTTLELPDPLTVIASVKIDDGTETFSTTVTDYTALPDTAPVDNLGWTVLTAGATPWPTEPNRIQISGVWGDPIPAGVKIACLIQVARIMSRPRSPLGLAGGFGEFGAMRVFGGGWDQDALARLAPYRTRAFAVG